MQAYSCVSWGDAHGGCDGGETLVLKVHCLNECGVFWLQRRDQAANAGANGLFECRVHHVFEFIELLSVRFE
jgi:hypothetical protein